LPDFSTGDNGVQTIEEPPARQIENIVELQIALARSGFFPAQSMARWEDKPSELAPYQSTQQLATSGTFDTATQQKLKIREPVFSQIELTDADFAKIDPAPTYWKERGSHSRMAYHSILEMIAEKSVSDPDLIIQLNPSIDWNYLQSGLIVLVPHV
jgi:hypothetical protein